MEETAELTRRWVARMRRADAATIAVLRDQPGIEAASAGDDIWLRGGLERSSVIRELIEQPALAVFETEDDRLLHPLGMRAPTDRLPPGLTWSALADVTRPLAVKSVLPATMGDRVMLRLVRCPVERPVNLLRLRLSAIAGWMDRAPESRFEGLKYAGSEDGEVIVLGDPLPPVSADRYVLDDGVAVPAGWRLDPPVPISVVQANVGTTANTIVMLDRECQAEVIELNHFVPLTRASVRLTLKPERGDVE